MLVRARGANAATEALQAWMSCPVLFLHGAKAHSPYFSETACAAAAEPKELAIVPGASHTDLYDRVAMIPLGKLTTFFRAHLA
jgi:fermentation-respiration switch protein FrsA (DUF1100 family)